MKGAHLGVSDEAVYEDRTMQDREITDDNKNRVDILSRSPSDFAMG